MNYKHGMTGTPTYSSWESMKKRCLCKTYPRYQDTGGRGIHVCSRWLKFENFYADMGLRPEGTSLDRVDNEGDYTSQNCRWATAEQQAVNKRPYQTGGRPRAMPRGVSFHRRLKRWQARLCRQKQVIHIGYFNTMVEAAAAYQQAKSAWKGK